MIGALTQLHENDRVVGAAMKWPGQVSVLAVAVGLLLWHEVATLIIAGLVLVTLVPRHRRALLSLVAVAILAIRSARLYEVPVGPGALRPEYLASLDWLPALVRFGAILAFLYAFYSMAARFDRLPPVVRRYPVICFHLLLLALLAAVGAVPALVLYLPLFPYLAWRVSYMILSASRGRAANTAFADHLFYLWPAFGGAQLPIGKGFDYLSRTEAADREQLVRSQLAGIKLLVLAFLWFWTRELMDAAVYAKPDNLLAPLLGGWSLGLPTLEQAVRDRAADSVGTAWMVTLIELIWLTLSAAIIGHVVVGSLRLMGFNVFRNTYRPLLSRSIIDFWQRYAYYFKEICVEFFFYPAYLRSAWAGPRLRLFIAVFAAAFFGNMYYHLLTEPELLVGGDLGALAATWDARIIYCLGLATGIWVSMLRQQTRRAAPGTEAIAGLTALRRIAGVWVFYGLIHIFNVKADGATLTDRVTFFGSLFGL